MILNNLDSLQLDKFPVIIFGSGPAGISTALELEKKNINSLIIEAGNENYSEKSQDFYKGKITPKCYIQAKRNDNNYSSMNWEIY